MLLLLLLLAFAPACPAPCFACAPVGLGAPIVTLITACRSSLIRLYLPCLLLQLQVPLCVCVPLY
jgi:hypothetical protein